jgi:hypothetical protein
MNRKQLLILVLMLILVAVITLLWSGGSLSRLSSMGCVQPDVSVAQLRYSTVKTDPIQFGRIS